MDFFFLNDLMDLFLKLEVEKNLILLASHVLRVIPRTIPNITNKLLLF